MHESPVEPLALLRDASEHARLLAGAAGERRSRVIEELRHAVDFPVTLVVRGLVVGRRDLPEPCLEVVPEGFGRAAFDTLGPLLVPTDRPLEPGSVVTARVDLVDPARYAIQPPALLARTLTLQASVAVEP